MIPSYCISAKMSARYIIGLAYRTEVGEIASARRDVLLRCTSVSRVMVRDPITTWHHVFHSPCLDMTDTLVLSPWIATPVASASFAHDRSNPPLARPVTKRHVCPNFHTNSSTRSVPIFGWTTGILEFSG